MADSEKADTVSDGAAEVDSSEEQDEENGENVVTVEYQPLLLMKDLFEKYSNQLRLLDDQSLLELATTGFIDEINETVTGGKTTYYHTKIYVRECIETIKSLSELQISLIKKYREKIEEESKEMLSGIDANDWKDWEEVRLVKHRDDSSKYERFAAVARSLGDLQKLADQLLGAFNTLHDEIDRIQLEAAKIAEEEEQLRREEEARVKAEKERQRQIEEERLRKEEEEKAQQEDEERRKKEEEERKRKGEELKAKREEEARRKREAEDERKRLEEEKRRRLEEDANPVNWEPYKYNADGGLFSQIAVLRVPKEGFIEEDVCFELAEESVSNYLLGPDEELMSEIINMKLKKDETISYDIPSWLAIALPYFPPSHREVVMKRLNQDGTWDELPTRPAKIPSITESKFVEAPFEVLDNTTITVISRLKVDTRPISSRETKIESSVDPRVRVTFPKNSIRFNANAHLTVYPVQPNTIDRLKDRNEAARKLLSSTGHLISIKGDKKFREPVIVSVPSPGGRKGKDLPRVSSSGRISAMSAKSARSQYPAEDEPLFLAWKSQNKWHHTESPEISVNGDVVSFEVDTNKVDRILLMKMNQDECSSQTITSIASQVEQTIRATPVQMVTRQKSKEKSSIFLTISPSDQVDRELAFLKQNDYDDGPMPSAEVELCEGQKLEFKFSGNVIPDDDSPIEFTFNSNLRNSMRELFVKEKDIFDQKSSDEYRGYAEMWTKGPLENPSGSVLAKMPVTLPKAYSRDDNIPLRVPIPPPNDPILTDDLLRTFSRELVDDWQKLIKYLNFKQSLVPGIKLQYADDEEEMVYNLLLKWYSRSGVMTNKAETLRSALKSCHRHDLARVIEQGGEGWNKENKAWNEVFRRLSRGNEGVIKEWRHLFRLLAESVNLPDVDVMIHTIRQQEKGIDVDCCTMALRKWREAGGSNATPYLLITCLKEIDNALAAEEAEDIFKRHEMI